MRCIVPPGSRSDRRLGAALLVAAVALLHGLALHAIDAVEQPHPTAGVTAMQVQRVVELPPPAAAATLLPALPPAPPQAADPAPTAAAERPVPRQGIGAAQAGATRSAPGPAAARRAPSQPTVLGSGTVADREADPSRELAVARQATGVVTQRVSWPQGDGPGAAAQPEAGSGSLPLEAMAASAVAEAAASAEDVPVYATRLPGPAQRRYRLQRGILSGEGEFAWQPASPAPGSAYEARLVGRVAGLTVLDWTSRGRIDAAGVAPERFVVRRLGRDAQAANFQRDAGKITYSGPRSEFPLPPGAQDRLSWMVQLPGVLAAEPKRFAQPGAVVNFFVSGARGDADVWAFRVLGSEPVTLVDGREVQAIKLMREPRKPYDTRAEVWLEPAMSYLPARARLTPGGGGEPLELTRLPE